MTPIVFYHSYSDGITHEFLARLARTTLDPELHVLKNQEEYQTLDALWQRCKEAEPDAPVLYAHTKGATSEVAFPCVAWWREMMEYFCLDEWKESVARLSSADVVGCNLSYEPWPHFSGNFWWARAGYITTLVRPVHWCRRDHRLDAERWVCVGEGKFVSLHSSGVNHYKCPYPPEKYRHVTIP